MASIAFLGLLLLAVAAHGGRQSASRLRDDPLVTMTKEELKEIIYCVSNSRDTKAQKRAKQCGTLCPKQTIAAFEQCRYAVVGSSAHKFYDTLAAHPELIMEVYECIRQNTVKYTKKDAMQMIQFETCARSLYATISRRCRSKSSQY